jgi:hypothetical protein
MELRVKHPGQLDISVSVQANIRIDALKEFIESQSQSYCRNLARKLKVKSFAAQVPPSQQYIIYQRHVLDGEGIFTPRINQNENSVLLCVRDGPIVGANRPELAYRSQPSGMMLEVRIIHVSDESIPVICLVQMEASFTME